VFGDFSYTDLETEDSVSTFPSRTASLKRQSSQKLLDTKADPIATCSKELTKELFSEQDP